MYNQRKEQMKEKQKVPPKIKMWLEVFKKMGVNMVLTDMEGNPVEVGDDK